MAYVPIAYPSVLYSPAGVPQPVATAAIAATLPANYAAVPVVAAPAPAPSVDVLAAYDPATSLQLVLGMQALVIVAPSAAPVLVVNASGPEPIDTL